MGLFVQDCITACSILELAMNVIDEAKQTYYILRVCFFPSIEYTWDEVILRKCAASYSKLFLLLIL